MPSQPHAIRQGVLALALLGVGVTLLRLLLAPTGGRQVSAFAFPERVPLPGWAQTGTRSLRDEIPADQKRSIPAARQYRYRQEARSLRITMHYSVGALGSFDGYRAGAGNVDVGGNLQTRRRPGTGHYKVFDGEGRAHLVSCINPDGAPTTASTDGFFAIHNRPGYVLQQLPAWLAGQQSLRDRRCLWAHLSVPRDQGAAGDRYAPLEDAFEPWVRWWQQHYPDH